MKKASQINTSAVTGEQIGRCYKCFEGSKGFYKVESESDVLIEYSVKWSAAQGFTCTCNAGRWAFAHCSDGICKHIRWAVACEREVQAALKLISEEIVAAAEKARREEIDEIIHEALLS